MNENIISDEKQALLHSLSLVAIKNDRETLKALTLAFSQPIVALGIVPYPSLFCSLTPDASKPF